MKMWIHRVTLKTIVDIQKARPQGLADSIYELIAAFRLYAAIDALLQGDEAKAQEHFSKVRPDKFWDTDRLLRMQAHIKNTYRQEDPFTDTCVAAHQQLRDWHHLTNGCDEAKRAKIEARHAMYKQCQHELKDADDARREGQGESQAAAA